ncbi:hypothetical protein TNCV_1744601 [Trichonephila clavipes]|nr:hypothetical protein TNCV_1744601 [Trichonephila clavipes]
MGLLFVAMLEPCPIFSKMLLRPSFIAHQVWKNPYMDSVPSKKILSATTRASTVLWQKAKEKYKGLSNEVLNMIKPTYLEFCTKGKLT